MGKIILTGDRPTGRLHLGHYVGSLRRRVELQESGEFERIFIMIADAQALTEKIEQQTGKWACLAGGNGSAEAMAAALGETLSEEQVGNCMRFARTSADPEHRNAP